MALPPRSSFVVRLSHELHDSLKKLSEESGISLNTLVVSMLQWASDHASAGEPMEITSSAIGRGIATNPVHGVVWVGREGGSAFEDEYGEPYAEDPGEVYFVIDDRPESRLTRVKRHKESE